RDQADRVSEERSLNRRFLHKDTKSEDEDEQKAFRAMSQEDTGNYQDAREDWASLAEDWDAKSGLARSVALVAHKKLLEMQESEAKEKEMRERLATGPFETLKWESPSEELAARALELHMKKNLAEAKRQWEALRKESTRDRLWWLMAV